MEVPVFLVFFHLVQESEGSHDVINEFLATSVTNSIVKIDFSKVMVQRVIEPAFPQISCKFRNIFGHEIVLMTFLKSQGVLQFQTGPLLPNPGTLSKDSHQTFFGGPYFVRFNHSLVAGMIEIHPFWILAFVGWVVPIPVWRR